MNIVSLAMQVLTPALVGKIASSLGMNQSLVTKAIGAALPTILAGLVGAASKPGGGQQISDAISRQDGGLLGNIGNMIGGQGQSDLVKMGTSVLGGLLGGSAVSSLAGAVGKFTGASEGNAGSLVGMLAPMVLGSLGQQQKSQNLDAGGLASMLQGQKQNIAEAMPKGFADLLGGTGLLDSIGSQLKAASAAAPTPQHAPPIPQVQPQASSGGLMKWVLAGLAAVLLGWYFLKPSATPQVAMPSIPAMPKLMVDGQDIGGQARAVAEGLAATLKTVKDEASAKAALPKLQDADKTLGTITGLAAKLPADGRKSLATGTSGLLTMLRPLIDQALAASGAGPILKPIVDGILNKMQGLSKV